MNVEKLIKNLTEQGFKASYFETGEKAATYLTNKIKGEIVGFGGSKTAEALGLYEKLGANNEVLWHWKNPVEKDRYSEFTTYITSANGVSETGEIVNIDGNGNRIGSTFLGVDKLYFVIGTNKIEESLEKAIFRARNVAAPMNAKRFNRATPCVASGRCHDCNSPERICRGMSIHMRPLTSAKTTEVIIINESLGF